MDGMTTAERLNSTVRFAIYFASLFFLTTGVTTYMLAIPIVMALSVVFYYYYPNGTTIEPFKIDMRDKKSREPYTMPTANNPFMNVLLTEILDDPNRGDAAPTNRRDVKADIYKSFQKTTDIYMDTTDLFDQSQAMRTFHTLQSAKVPNDLDGFKQWLAKGLDQPDYSSTAPARHAKILNEAHGNESCVGARRSQKPARRLNHLITSSLSLLLPFHLLQLWQHHRSSLEQSEDIR